MLLATLKIPPEALALEHTASALPGIEIEAERVAAHSTGWVMPCLWVAHEEFGTVEETFRSDPTIAAIVESATHGDEAFYQVEWAEEVERRIDSYVDKEGSILEARLVEGSWEVDVRFVNREQFDDFREAVSNRGHSFHLLSLSESERSDESGPELTPAQREALVAATNCGYFRVPREATTEDLADELGISHQAVSELLRRGTENLVRTTLLAG